MGMASNFMAWLEACVLSPQIKPDNVERALRGLRDGTLSVVDFRMICVMEGIVFGGNFGSGVTVAAGHTTANYLVVQPDFNLDVPAGTAALIFPPIAYLQTTAGTLNNVRFCSINQLLGNGTSSAAAVGPVNIRSDRKRGSACTARQVYTGSGVALATGASQIEHWGSGYAFADATGAPVKAFGPGPEWAYPLLIGPASFNAYFTGTTTAPTGFAQFHWAEFDSTRFA